MQSEAKLGIATVVDCVIDEMTFRYRSLLEQSVSTHYYYSLTMMRSNLTDFSFQYSHLTAS